MFDGPPPIHQRSHGAASVALDAGPRLRELAQSGSAKAFLPRVDSRDPEVVFLNTSGGLTGGDILAFGLRVGADARVTATTQTAERVYNAGCGVARMSVELSVAQGARLHWLPQETILFDHAALERETSVRLAGDAELLWAESVVLGRAAMGETLSHVTFSDCRRIYRDGQPVLIEPLEICTADLRRTDAAGLGSARVLATVALLAGGAEDALEPARALPVPEGVTAFASAWNGKIVLRAAAPDGWPLKRWLASVLEHLGRAPLPRVWQI